jgi:hypothetical protein
MGDDSWRERRQSTVDRAARRARAERDGLVPPLQCGAREELHGRLLGSARGRQVARPQHPSSVDDGRAVHLGPRRAGRGRVQAPRQDEGGDPRALVGLCPRGPLRRALSREGRGVHRQRADRRLAGGRVGLVRLRDRRSAAPRQAEGGEEAAGNRPAAAHGRELVDAAHVAVAARGPHAAARAAEARSGRARRPGVLDLRSAPHHARIFGSRSARCGPRSRA